MLYEFIFETRLNKFVILFEDTFVLGVWLQMCFTQLYP